MGSFPLKGNILSHSPNLIFHSHIEEDVYFQTTPFNLSEPDNSKVPFSTVRNFNDGIFQIWPKLNYDANKEFKERNEFKSINKNIVKKKLTKEEKRDGNVK